MLKFSIMRRKLLNFVKSKRFIDIFCYAFCIFYFIFAISVACVNAIDYKNQEQSLNDMLAYMNAVNKNLELEYSIKKEDTTIDEEDIPSEPLFSDGKTALLSAYSEFYNANSFVININGTMSTSAMGINLKVNYVNNSVKYSQNKTYNELLVKYLDASSMQSQIDEILQCGKRTLIENGTILQRETFRVKRENSTLKGYDWKEITNEKESYPVANNLMIINEDTIEKITYFKIKESKGKPQYYYVQAILKPEKATENFKNTIAFSIGKMSFTAPNYTECKVTACIDATGTLIGLTCQDVGKVAIEGPIVGGMSVTCNYDYSYVINGINNEINYVPEGF